jgi:ABC-2 type transport system ATP-binding protein
MSIRIDNVRKHFYEDRERKDILQGIALEIRPGEIFALTGANGAGKTTLLKILATLLLPDSGSATIAGKSITADAASARRATGFAFDPDRSFYQVLDVEENLRFFGTLYGLGRRTLERRLSQLLQDLSMESWKKVKLSHCSSGIRQKLAIVRALLTDPPVLLIDELTRSLDTTAVKEVSSYLSLRIRSEKKTCILVTHDIVQAKEMGCRIGVLKNGVINE